MSSAAIVWFACRSTLFDASRTSTPFVRFFTIRADAEEDPWATDPFIANPWADAFSGGTQNSAGLLTALHALERDGVEQASILLVSDLETAPGDRPRLVDALVRLRQEGVQVRIVSLAPLDEARAVFTGILGDDAFIEPAEVRFEGGRMERRLEGASPRPLLLAGFLVLLLAGAHERLLTRLPLPEREAAA